MCQGPEALALGPHGESSQGSLASPSQVILNSRPLGVFLSEELLFPAAWVRGERSRHWTPARVLPGSPEPGLATSGSINKGVGMDDLVSSMGFRLWVQNTGWGAVQGWRSLCLPTRRLLAAFPVLRSPFAAPLVCIRVLQTRPLPLLRLPGEASVTLCLLGPPSPGGPVWQRPLAWAVGTLVVLSLNTKRLSPLTERII